MATFTIKETAPVVYAFTKNNIKGPLLSILPYAVICGAISAIAGKTHPGFAFLAQLATFYFSGLYASNIHRAFLHGIPATRFDPFRPVKDDWRFMGMILLICFIGLLIGGAIGLVSGIIGSKILFVIAILIAVIVTAWWGFRASLVFPDRAIGGHMKIRESFDRTEGLVSKMILVPLASSWRVILVAFGWMILVGVIEGFVLQKFFPGDSAGNISPTHKLVLYFLAAPASIGMTYWYSATCVATLSNYYLWVKENRSSGLNDQAR